MRERQNEPIAAGDDIRSAPPPNNLHDGLATVWQQVASLVPKDIAGKADQLAFEALVRLIYTMRSREAKAAHFARLQSLLAEFGMTPAARARLCKL
ncbi:hypothetical protein GCM10022600_25140 [Qipengyuania pelagi]|uniref:Uncharacterized protein n=1 Tax=Qipengyuania pelagi TaxID=994320 RepID=A0A844Y493_9SPHN|nr:P27 family phage terminase small subunit [Qipengyuania pelagi]MXO52646.1 hypothetical protein [Qipengyuania pelagi]